MYIAMESLLCSTATELLIIASTNQCACTHVQRFSAYQSAICIIYKNVNVAIVVYNRNRRFSCYRLYSNRVRNLADVLTRCSGLLQGKSGS